MDSRALLCKKLVRHLGNLDPIGVFRLINKSRPIPSLTHKAPTPHRPNRRRSQGNGWMALARFNRASAKRDLVSLEVLECWDN